MTKGKVKSVPTGWFDRILSRPYLSICLFCSLLYVQILSFGLVHFDDHGFVLMASDTLKLSNIPDFFRHSVFWVLGDTTQDTDVFYRPMQNVVYAICNTIASEKPWIYHFVGLLLHVFTACLLFRFLSAVRVHVSLALVFTLLYAAHPVLVQGVAWIAGIGDQLAAVFTLLSVYYFLEGSSGGALPPPYKGGVPTRSGRGILHLLFFAAALFSKEVSIMIVPVCLLYYFLHSAKENKIANLPFRGWGLALGWMLILALYFSMRSAAIHPPKVNLLSSALESFRVNGPLLFEYFEKIFFPWRLSPIPSRDDAQLIIGLVLFISLVGFIIYKKRFTRLLLFGALWFMLFLFPSFIQQNPQAHFFAFEHRLYLPLIGIVIVVMEMVGLQQLNFKSSAQRVVFPLLLLLLFVAAFAHSRTFSDPYTFYDKALSSSPRSVIAYNGYGKLLLEDKKYAEAIGAFKKSHEYKPDDLETTGKIADVYLKDLNDPQQAAVWFRKTLDIAPNSIKAVVSLADVELNYLKDTAKAIAGYENALKIEAENEFAATSLGIIHISKGRNEQGRDLLSRALKASPASSAALKWMAISFFNESKVQNALEFLERAYRHYPDDPDLQRNLLICHYKLGHREETARFAGLAAQVGISVPAEITEYLKAGK